MDPMHTTVAYYKVDRTNVEYVVAFTLASHWNEIIFL